MSLNTNIQYSYPTPRPYVYYYTTRTAHAALARCIESYVLTMYTLMKTIQGNKQRYKNYDTYLSRIKHGHVSHVNVYIIIDFVERLTIVI